MSQSAAAEEGDKSLEKDDLVKQFREITGVDAERARFYLEASDWKLQVAMGGFYETADADMNADSDDASIDQEVTNLSSQGTQLPLNVLPIQGRAQAPPPPSGVRGGTGPMTLDALRALMAGDDDSTDEDDNKQAFYAGGSQSSGQQVLGPAKKRDDLIADMFKKAREHGAEEIEAPAPQFLKRKGGGGGTFGGAGHKLGDEATVVSSESAGAQDSTAPSSSSPVREVVLRLWSQGFTLDGGELREYHDPNNLTFLGSVKRGEVPRELIREYSGQEVSLTMEDRRTEDYVPPKQLVRPFVGKGNMLGSPAPSTVTSATVTAEDKTKNEKAAQDGVGISSETPTTNIQFRLADGSRLRATFNTSHTINDLHSFINTARPEYSSVNYSLTLLPNTQLVNKEISLEAANVLNSALVQKIIQS